MGTIKQGILGGFSGKVGTVVGGSWKGVSYMRSLAQNIKNPRTAAQMGQRTKFGLVSAGLQPLTPILRTGWKLHADGKSAFNAATAHTLANAITGTYPDYAIDPARILIARGSLTPAAGASVALTEGGSDRILETEHPAGAGMDKELAHTQERLSLISNILTQEDLYHKVRVSYMEEENDLLVKKDNLEKQVAEERKRRTAE